MRRNEVIKHSRKVLLEALNKIGKIRMLVVGDAIIDRYIWGDVERISPEAPVPVLDVRRAEDRLGGAANVANNLAQLGVTVSLAALIGDDDEAESLKALLSERKISTSVLVADSSRCTTVKTRVMAGQQQIVRIDHEVRDGAQESSQGELAARIDSLGTQGLLISDYGKGVVGAQVLAAVERAVGRGASVMVDPHPTNYTRYHKLGMCKPNRKEAESATGIKITDDESAARAAQSLMNVWGCSTVVLSLGANGVCIVDKNSASPIFLPTQARQVFDVSGAGDTLAAVFAAAKYAGVETPIAGELANLAAGVVVSRVGTVPVTRELLEKEIQEADR